MNKLATLALGAGLLGACDGSYRDGFEDGLEQGQGGVNDGGSDDGDDTGVTDEQNSHAELCRELLADAELALANGYTANVTVDADPNELNSGYEDGNVWMYDAFDTDDGNDQTHVPCTSLRIDGDWEVAGEADWAQNGSDLDMLVDFDGKDFEDSSMLKLSWVVLQNSGPRFATDMNGNEDTIYTIDHDLSEPVGY